MDNDNLLVQKAADLYRGLRFKMKYPVCRGRQ